MPLFLLSCSSLADFYFFNQKRLHRSHPSEAPPGQYAVYLQEEGDAVYAGFVRQVDLDEGGCQRCQVRLQVSSPAKARGRHAAALQGGQPLQKDTHGDLSCS